MQPGGLLAPLPGHRRGALGHGLVRLADDLQQRPRRDRRRRRPARAAARRGGRGARGLAATTSSSAAARSSSRARPTSRSRSPKLAGGGTFHGKGAGEVPDAPDGVPAEGCVGRLGLESFHAPQLIAHAVRVRVDRGTGVVRVLEVAAAHDCGTILNRIGADGQVYGGVVMGIGQALSEGTQLDDDGTPAQPAPHRLQARDRVRRAADRHRLDRDRHAERRAEGLEGRRRAAVRADRRRGRERDREGDRRARAQAADDAGARVGGRRDERHVLRTPPRSVDDALAALAAGARPVAGGTDLVVGARSGKSPLPDSIVAIHRIAELHGVESRGDGGLRLGALASHARSPRTRDVRARFTALADACAIVGSHATRAQGTIGGNVMNASPAMETGGPLICFGATATLQSPSGSSGGRGRRPLAGPGRHDGRGRRAARRDPRSRSGRRHGQRLPPARVPAADGDRRRRRDGRRHARRRAR